jgi:hypothetical protein
MGFAAVAVVGALATHPQPTAESAGDIAVTILFAVAVTVVSARSRPVAWLAAWVMVLLAGGVTTAAPAALGVGVSALAVARSPRRPDLFGAALGAALVQVVLRLPAGQMAVNLVASALAVAALVLGSSWNGGDRARRAGLVALAAVGVVLLAIVVNLLLVRRDLESAIDRADAGLQAARRGESTEAARELRAASGEFRSANAHLTSWLGSPTRYLPVVGQHARSLEIVSGAGADLASAASSAALAAGSDRLRIRNGRIDLEQVAALAGPLADVRSALNDAATIVPTARSRWLVGPLADRIDGFEATIDHAIEEAATAQAAVEVAPSLLGGTGPRTYFVAFGNPAEARELGGFMGAFAIIQADRGHVRLLTTARVRDINRLMSGRELADRSTFPAHYLALQPQVFWQNVTGAADFPTVAHAVTKLWPSRALGALDGVLYLDPIALADLLEVTGPIRLDGLDRPLTAKTAPEFLLRGQYAEFPGDDRSDFLTDAAETVFEELTSHEIDGPAALTDALAPAAKARRIVLYSSQPQEEALFRRLDLDGALDLGTASDLLSVRTSNRGLNKVDAMLRRHVTCNVTVDPAHGTVHSTVEVVLTNGAPPSGLPAEVLENRLGNPPGTSSTTLALYTPLDLVDVTADDGDPVPSAVTSAHGFNRYAVLLDIPPGDEVRLHFELEGRMDTADGYSLRVIPQPLAQPDRLDVDVRTADGWTATGRTSVHRSHVAAETVKVRIVPSG